MRFANHCRLADLQPAGQRRRERSGGVDRQIPELNRDKGDDTEMLDDYPIDLVLLATDLEAARDFYRDKIGSNF